MIKKIKIGSKFPCFIIAEIGINHGGSFERANKLVDEAFNCGANAVKFQIANPFKSYQKDTPSYKEFIKSSLNFDEYNRIIKKFQSRGEIFATPGDIESLKLCKKLKLNIYKVSSGLVNNLVLIREIAKTKMPIILSTGMASLREIKEAVRIAKRYGCKEVYLLHCTSIYPAPSNSLNLDKMLMLKNKTNLNIGYSDHHMGIKASTTAVAMGAKIIEKHFTLDNNIKGADHKISLNPADFKEMVLKIREIELLKGKIDAKLNKIEQNNAKKFRRYCVASKDINKGDKFTLDNVCFMRIRVRKNAIPASYFLKIENKIASNSYKKFKVIKSSK